MLPIRQTLQLKAGVVTLRAWPASVADGHLLELLTLTGTLGTLHEAAGQYRRGDVEPGIWAAFWRLVRASLEPGQELPQPLTWGDRITLLNAMYELNDIEDTEGKWRGLTEGAARLLKRVHHRQARQTAP